MHISLDSALGRQRRLNSVGESVFQIAPDASAGYSLRSLTGGDPSVVRVRRDSDNGERDFRSSEINSGEMVSWVNQQAIKPLDIRELEADGRTGDFLIPKAAYSLRSLGARQATLAATGDTVARADGKFVIQARRTSDDALKSFTADEVTDGTLTAWVTEYVANLVGNARYFNGTSTSVEVDRPATDSFAISGSFLSVNTGGYGILSFGDDINNRFYLGAASSGRIQIFNVNAGSLVFDQTVLTDYADGTIHNFSFVTGVSGTILTIDGSEIINISTQIRTGNYATSKMRFGSRFTTAYASYIQGTLYDITIDSTNAYTGLGTSVTAWEDTIGSNNGTEVNGATYTGQGFDGMVSKWYDQSVTNQAGGTATGNHAVQATAASQPKIVNAGALVVGGLDFDNVDDTLVTINTDSFGTSSRSIFSVCSPRTVAASADGIVQLSTDESTGAGWLFTPELATRTNNTTWISSTPASTVSNNLITGIYTSGNLHAGNAMFLDGASVNRTSGTDGAINTTTSVITIGSSRAGAQPFDGPIAEIIIYKSDQSDNRTAIEANIGEAYSIAGIPAYANTVNGFVETWYDQSGNSKDATQATASLQPKIVNAGSLLTDGIDFDGTDQVGLVTGSFSLTQAFTTFSVSHTDDASTSLGIWSTAASATDNFNTASFFRNDDGFAVNAGATLTTAGTIDYVADRTYLQTNVVNGGSSSIFVDGATGATGNAGSTNPSGILIIGYFRSGGYFPLDGAIKELIIYDSDQTSNRAALETNIAAANGVTLS